VRRDGRHSPGRRSDNALLVHIKAIHAEVRGEYGWPRIWKELFARGIRVGKDRVQKLMRQHGIKTRGKRKFIATSDSNHGLPVAENLLNREFQPTMPNAVWTSDIKYIATGEGWLYLAVVIDLLSRQIVGRSVHPHMRRELVMDALSLCMAWFRRQPGKEARVIFHSDRDSQCCSGDFQDLLTEYGMRSSMSRKGNCGDNAPTESLWGSLKVGRLYGLNSRRRALRRTRSSIGWRSTTIDAFTRRWAMSARCNSNGLGSLPRKREPRNPASYGMRFPGAWSPNGRDACVSPLSRTGAVGKL
jgi:putative transposase